MVSPRADAAALAYKTIGKRGTAHASQKHEVRPEAEKTGAKPEEVRQAVKDVGNSRKKVESELEKK